MTRTVFQSIYQTIRKIVVFRFPSSLADLSIFADLRGRLTGQNTVDTARVMRLLQLSDEQLETVRTKDQMARLRCVTDSVELLTYP